jgi:hypothetical protein
MDTHTDTHTLTLSMHTQTRWGNPFLRAVVLGGIVSGVLDATDGVIAFGIQGLNPIHVLQYIASGAFGDSSFKGGLLTAGAGVAFHFFIAFVAAAVFAIAASKLRVLRTHWAIAGLVYGACVWAFMNLGVLPLSAVKPSPFSLPMFLNGIIGHALFVGLPIAYFSRGLGREPVDTISTESAMQA